MLYVADPHTINVANNLNNILLRRKNFQKLNFLHELFTEGKIEAVCMGGSSFPLHKIRQKLIRKYISNCEFRGWKYLNAINVKTKRLRDIPKDAFVLIDTNVPSSFNIKTIEQLNSKNVCLILYISHITSNTQKKLELLSKLTCKYYFISEARVSLPLIDSDKINIIPYFFHERFKLKQYNSNRIDQLLIVGTVNFSKDNKLEKYFGSDVLNPFRNELYKKRNNLPGFFNISQNYTLTNNSYYDLDLPLLFRTFRFFICPEDISGMPSSNMVEGMASGGVYFGNSSLSYYKDYGMEPYIHFIPYDGTISDLYLQYNKIKYKIDIVNKIAKNSMKLAEERFSRNAAKISFVNLIESFQ